METTTGRFVASQKWALWGVWPARLAVGWPGWPKRGESPAALATGRQRAGTAGARRGANRDLGQTSRPCLPLSLSLQRESANILISSHTQTLRPDPRIHILGDLHKLPAINRAHEVQGLKASTLAKKPVQEDWKRRGREGASERGWEHSPGERSSGMAAAGCGVWVSESLTAGAVPCFGAAKAASSAHTVLRHLPSASLPPRKGKQPPLPSTAHPNGCWGALTQPRSMAWMRRWVRN